MDDYDGRVPCEHCGELVDLSEADYHEATGWFQCPECDQMNTGE